MMSWNNAFFLLIPVFCIRYLYVALMCRSKLAELNFFPPAKGLERIGKLLYLLINTFLLFYPLFMSVEMELSILISGFLIYTLGIIIQMQETINRPAVDGLNETGTAYWSPKSNICFIILDRIRFSINTAEVW